MVDCSLIPLLSTDLCGGNGMNVLPYPNTLYMYDMDVGCSLKGSTASMIA